MLIQALLPPAIHAASTSTGFAAEICTAAGIKHVWVGQTDQSEAPPAAAQECPVCVAAALLALPFIDPAVPGALPESQRRLPGVQLPLRLGKFSTPPGRGPPAHA